MYLIYKFENISECLGFYVTEASPRHLTLLIFIDKSQHLFSLSDMFIYASIFFLLFLRACASTRALTHTEVGWRGGGRGRI